ncbi:MAG: YihY/virulence factor BrkB family protein [bacterium]
MGKKFKTAFEIARETVRAFREDDVLTLAAALSFYAILSLIPLSMILVSLLGHFLGQSEEVLGRIIAFITEVIPNLSPPFLHSLSAIISRKVTSGWIGTAFLFLVASVLFTNLEKILDKIFGSLRSRNFFHSRLLSVAFIFLTAVLLFIPAVIKNIGAALPFSDLSLAWAPYFTGNFFFFLVGWLSFVLVVAVVPNHEVRFKYNVLGGLLFALLLTIAKYVFRWYTGFSLARFNLVYGSLTALVLIILWIFYLINLLLLCAELVGVLQRRATEEALPEDSPSTQDE